MSGSTLIVVASALLVKRVNMSEFVGRHTLAKLGNVVKLRKREGMRLLLAIDGSKQSEAAVDEIARRCFPANSEVRVISVVEPPNFGEGVDMSLYVEVDKTARERARAAVEKAAAKLRADEGSRQLNVTTEVISGSPKGVILEQAEAFGPDLIIVGSHGHGMLDRFLLGSVSHAVALHAKCSVEIVRSPKTEPLFP